MIFPKGNMEILLKTIGSGQISGEDSFFNACACTLSMVSISSVNLNCLYRKDLDELEIKFQGLSSRLKAFCETFENTNDLIQSIGLNRREHDRKKVEGRIEFRLVNSEGSPIGNPFKGRLEDISKGVFSFFIRSSKAKNARVLLGRKLQLKFSLQLSGKIRSYNKLGMVIGVISHMFSDYSIHIKF